MKRPSKLAVTVVLGSLVLLTLTAFGSRPPVTVIFGHESAGSEIACGPHDADPTEPPSNRCPPDRAVGQSAEATDALIPRTVAIKAGGAITYDNSGAPHRVGICEEGLTPDEIALPASGNVITDTRCVVAGPGVDVTKTFTEPGKYLIICGFVPHFVEREQYGWAIVQ